MEQHHEETQYCCVIWLETISPRLQIEVVELIVTYLEFNSDQFLEKTATYAL